MLTFEIICDNCGKKLNIANIQSEDSASVLCDISDWAIIAIPENNDGTEYKEYYLCDECEEETFYRSKFKCSSTQDNCDGTMFKCIACKLDFCRKHFDYKQDLCLDCSKEFDKMLEKYGKKNSTI